MDELKKMLSRLLAAERNVLKVAVALTIALLSAVCFWKYAMFAYNAIDLAYFNQVFWNTVHGRPFTQSIHPHLSLGDHAELIILLLAPVYAVLQDPRTLLFLQAAALALCAFPIFRIAKARLGAEAKHGPLRAFPLLLSLAWLASPFVHNIALFEFHLLPFALFPLFQAMGAYEEGRKSRFLAWIFLALMVREDVALVVALIGILAWIEGRSRWWRLTPLALGAIWFFAMTRLIASFAPGGGYKYLVYYVWLGRTPWEMLVNAARDPLKLAAHVFTVPNLEMVIGFLLPLLFLPLLAPRRLILALAPCLQIILGAPGGGELILQTHYATLFLPALWLAAIDGVRLLPMARTRGARLRALFRPEDWLGFAHLAFVIAAVFGALALGPLPAVVAAVAAPGEMSSRAVAAREIVSRVPSDAPVAAGYALMPALSSRERFFSAHYLFLGVTQFAEGPYAPPSDLRFVALDADDLLTYRAQFLGTGWAAPHYEGGLARLSKALGAGVAFASPFALYETEGTATMTLPRTDTAAGDGLLMAHSTPRIGASPSGGRSLEIAALWRLDRAAAEGLSARLVVKNADGDDVLAVRQAMAAPPPFALLTPAGVVTAFAVPVGLLPAGRYSARLVLEHEDATYTLDGLRSAVRTPRSIKEKNSVAFPSFDLP